MSADGLSNTIAKIRNALAVNKRSVCIPFSNLNVSVIRILRQKGFIETFSIFKHSNHFSISITLKYYEGKPTIRSIRQISTPGRRVFKQYKEVEAYMNGLGTLLFNTSKGIITERLARKLRVGGEVLCSVY